MTERQGRLGRFLLLLVAFSVMPHRLPAQHTVGELIASFTRRGRTVQDIVVDRRGAVHVAWTVLAGGVHDPGTLFYSRIDKSGTSTAESQVSQFGGAYDIRLDLGRTGRPLILYHQMQRFYFACFDSTGVMQTTLDRKLTPEETDAQFECSRDEEDNIYIFGRGAIDYFWKIDPVGKVLEERRGRWLRRPTPGFVCLIANPATLLLLWHLNGVSGGQSRGRTIRMLKFNLASFSQEEPRDLDLARVSEARLDGIGLVSPRLVRSGRDILLLTSVPDSAGGVRTFRVRFNARGDPVRRWDVKRIYHVQADEAGAGDCDFRVGVLRGRRQGSKEGVLEGIGRDGNIYHLNADLPALRSR